ncbi:MAG: hypothetical protein LBV23_11600 [Deltaproteobacteria bacterium]|jgi:hemolysin activation/secretion protein|nr:hypothetical protein [Deltaproteobacteria bacterium]
MDFLVTLKHRRLFSIILFIVASSFFFLTSFSPAQAQGPARGVPDAGTILKETESARPQAPPRRSDSGLAPDGQIQSPITGQGGSMFVRDFKIEGAQYVKEEELQAVLAPYKGRELTYDQIMEAADQITALYRQKGFMMAKAYIPPQKAQDGVITFRMVVGKFGQLTLDNKSLVSDNSLLKTINSRLQSGDPIERSVLERTVLIIGDLPGANVPTIYTSTGKEQETADFQFNVSPARRFDGYFVTDNQGSYYTGKWRFMGGVDLNSPFGIGDKLSLFGLITDTRDLTNIGLSYSLPIGHDGLRLNASYSRVDYDIGKEFKEDLVNGWANAFALSLTYPVIRSSSSNLYLELNLNHTDMLQQSAIWEFYQKRRITSGTLQVRRESWSDLKGHNFYSQIQVGTTVGKVTYPNPEEALKNSAKGSFGRFNLDLTGQLSLTENLSLYGSAIFQKALGGHLDTSEALDVSNVGGHKMFREVVSGDNGYAGTLELRYRLPNVGSLNHNLGLFLYTAGWCNEVDVDLINSETMHGVGLNYNAQLGPGILNLQLTRTFGDYPEDLIRQDNSRIDGRTVFFVRFILVP